MSRIGSSGILLVGLLTWSPRVHAQAANSPPPPEVFTLDAALQYAVDHYPTVRAALEQVNVSTANVRIAQSAYLPRLDGVWQTNRATANNVSGQLLPQSVLPSLSGPVLPSESSQTVWGSAVGALFGWEPIDFGLRSATVRAAETGVLRARAEEAATKLDVQQAVGDAFLVVVGARQAVAAAEADVQRRDVLARAARALADNQLRPGADASRATAERAAAETRAIQARQMLVIAQTTLRRVLGITAGQTTVNAGRLIDALPPPSGETIAAAEHPLAQSRRAAVDVARAEEDVLAKSNLPRLYLQSSIFARGSGADSSGSFDGSAHGLGFDRANWAAGIQVVFPNLFDFSSLRARRAASASSTRAETARYDEAILTVTGRQQTADALAQAAREIAMNTPVQLVAARENEAQARARYDAGLASIVEVAEAQALLAQAEYQDAVARVDVWRALLAQAVARGNVGPFIELVRGSGAP
jgi:outer membrane protein